MKVCLFLKNKLVWGEITLSLRWEWKIRTGRDHLKYPNVQMARQLREWNRITSLDQQTHRIGQVTLLKVNKSLIVLEVYD